MPTSLLLELKLVPNADVLVALSNGHPLRGTRTDSDGNLIQRTLVDVPSESLVLITAHDGNDAEAKLDRTVPV